MSQTQLDAISDIKNKLSFYRNRCKSLAISEADLIKSYHDYYDAVVTHTKAFVVLANNDINSLVEFTKEILLQFQHDVHLSLSTPMLMFVDSYVDWALDFNKYAHCIIETAVTGEAPCGALLGKEGWNKTKVSYDAFVVAIREQIQDSRKELKPISFFMKGGNKNDIFKKTREDMLSESLKVHGKRQNQREVVLPPTHEMSLSKKEEIIMKYKNRGV